MLSSNNKYNDGIDDKWFKEFNFRKIEQYVKPLNEKDVQISKKKAAAEPFCLFVENFFQDDLPVYERAVRLCGQERFHIVDVVLDKYGYRLDGVYAVWAVASADINDFWNVLRELRSF